MKAKNADLIMTYAHYAKLVSEPWRHFEQRRVITSKLPRFVPVAIKRAEPPPPYTSVSDWEDCEFTPQFDSEIMQFRIKRDEKCLEFLHKLGEK